MNESQTARYTHIVKRDSGYVSGWLGSEQEAIDFAAECNREVPGDPAHAEALEEWPDELVSEAYPTQEYDDETYALNHPENAL